MILLAPPAGPLCCRSYSAMSSSLSTRSPCGVWTSMSGQSGCLNSRLCRYNLHHVGQSAQPLGIVHPLTKTLMPYSPIIQSAIVIPRNIKNATDDIVAILANMLILSPQPFLIHIEITIHKAKKLNINISITYSFDINSYCIALVYVLLYVLICFCLFYLICHRYKNQ